MSAFPTTDRICAGRVRASRDGRSCAACWGYWRESEDAAWAGWISDGIDVEAVVSVLGLDVAKALWQQSYWDECDRWRATIYECACCHKMYSRLEWTARDQRQGLPRVPSYEGGVVSTIKCRCGNGLSRVLSIEEIADGT